MFYLIIEQGLPFSLLLLKESPGSLIHCLLLKAGFCVIDEIFVFFCFFCIQRSPLKKSPQGRGLCDSNLKLTLGIKLHLKLIHIFVYRNVDCLNALGLPVLLKWFLKNCGCATSACSYSFMEIPPWPPPACAAPLTLSVPLSVKDTLVQNKHTRQLWYRKEYDCWQQTWHQRNLDGSWLQSLPAR